MIVQGRNLRSRADYWRGGSRRGMTSRAEMKCWRQRDVGGRVGDGYRDRGVEDVDMDTNSLYRGWCKVSP